MDSINSTPAALHQAYCEATSYELPLQYMFQELWLVASKEPWRLQPDDVKLVVKERIKLITQGERRTASIYLRNLIGTKGDQDGPLSEFQMELAAIRARMRKPVYEAGKMIVLEATGRETEPPSAPVRSIKDVMAVMREAAGK